MKCQFFNYRFADEVLSSPQYSVLRQEILGVLNGTAVPLLPSPKTRTRAGRTMSFTTDQQALNKLLTKAFEARSWQSGPSITNDKRTKLEADFKKGRVQVEVQFGNMARWYTDIFKFQVSYSLDLIDVGVLAVPMQHFANTIDENVAHFERVTRELPYARMSITIPIWVIGVEP